jgi:dihydrolipoamide dehydrogenase
MSETSFDLVVLGGGPGGYVAAIRASQLGMSTALVERARLGGVCLNWGCIPTKALLRAAEINHLLHHLDAFGFSAREVTFDLAKVVERSRRVANRLAAGVRHLLKKNRVVVFEGHGRLDGPGRVAVAKEGEAVAALRAPRVILATGAHPRSLPGLEPDGRAVWTYREAMVPETMPASVMVVGAGPIGIEFASFYRDMGAEVAVVEILPRILPSEDEEISALARAALEKRGIAFFLETTVASLDRTAVPLRATLRRSDGSMESLAAERVISAVGVEGNVEDVGLESTAVRVEEGRIVVDPWLETDESGVFAIGDAAGPPWLAHKASREGTICVEKLAGVAGLRPLDTAAIPACTYCRPQVASVGLTERAARESGRELKVGRFPFRANGKALALGATDGMVKTIFDGASGELLGAHMFGAEVTELIQGYAVARGLETTEAELMQAVFPHPTLSEAMQESVLDAFGRALHI